RARARARARGFYANVVEMIGARARARARARTSRRLDTLLRGAATFVSHTVAVSPSHSGNPLGQLAVLGRGPDADVARLEAGSCTRTPTAPLLQRRERGPTLARAWANGGSTPGATEGHGSLGPIEPEPEGFTPTLWR